MTAARMLTTALRALSGPAPLKHVKLLINSIGDLSLRALSGPAPLKQMGVYRNRLGRSPLRALSGPAPLKLLRLCGPSTWESASPGPQRPGPIEALPVYLYGMYRQRLSGPSAARPH